VKRHSSTFSFTYHSDTVTFTSFLDLSIPSESSFFLDLVKKGLSNCKQGKICTKLAISLLLRLICYIQVVI
jgi:hypothetical protein